jgi:glycerol-1-phosphate dehydrogenase [NAD(P)+]
MPSSPHHASTLEQELIEQALRSASHTRRLIVEPGARQKTAALFAQEFAAAQAIVIGDANTFAAAGRDVLACFQNANRPTTCYTFGPHIYANDQCANELENVLRVTTAIPVAVGSGTINDLTKLAAHRCGRPYMVVATAASMDGYTAYGASITAKGSKQTFECPAPRAVIADLDVISKAPARMNASGYADLLAKMPAGADWIVADVLGVEPIRTDVWNTVQQRLRPWIESAEAVAHGEPDALRRLVYGLMMSGFAMQAAQSSRPASGADHQFSHLWDMQHHTHEGEAPSHGFKVGIGTLASLALYEDLLGRDLESLDVAVAISKWPPLAALESHIQSLLGAGEVAEKAIEETRAKYVSPAELRGQLEQVKTAWPEIRERLVRQLLSVADTRALLRKAGCPYQPEQIGITRSRLRKSYWQALYIRRRFTVLDLAHRCGLFEASLEKLFGPGGAWSWESEAA